MEPYTQETEILALMEHLYTKIREAKPNDRGGIDRAYAIALTDTEKLISFWTVWVKEPAVANALEKK